MMGAGKSTVGSVLSRKLKLGFIDLDTLIENTQKLSISEIFKTFGEESFRKMECDTVCSIEPGRKLVISTGGGVVESKETIENLRKQDAFTILKRLRMYSMKELKTTQNVLF